MCIFKILIHSIYKTYYQIKTGGRQFSERQTENPTQLSEATMNRSPGIAPGSRERVIYIHPECLQC